MKKNFGGLLYIFIGIILVSCSSGGNEASESADMQTHSSDRAIMNEEMKMAKEETSNKEAGEQSTEEINAIESPTDPIQTNRKIIYNANLRVDVKNYNEAVNELQSQIQQTGGYIVESRSFGGADNELQEGMITARIPQEEFHQFIKIIEDGSLKVQEKTVTGEDVTEQFVDLESRLKSKKVVEQRLLSFMESSEKTEDLLKISEDLAKVQENIEQITGKMNYLQNKADLATVTIHIQENTVNVPGVNNADLNTWDKTKQQFMKSINFLLSTSSGFIVFTLGNLPVILLLLLIGFVSFRMYIKRKKHEKEDS